MFCYSEQRYTIYNALFALSIHRWILSNDQLCLQKYLYDTIRSIHTGRYVHRQRECRAIDVCMASVQFCEEHHTLGGLSNFVSANLDRYKNTPSIMMNTICTEKGSHTYRRGNPRRSSLCDVRIQTKTAVYLLGFCPCTQNLAAYGNA